MLWMSRTCCRTSVASFHGTVLALRASLVVSVVVSVVVFAVVSAAAAAAAAAAVVVVFAAVSDALVVFVSVVVGAAVAAVLRLVCFWVAPSWLFLSSCFLFPILCFQCATRDLLQRFVVAFLILFVEQSFPPCSQEQQRWFRGLFYPHGSYYSLVARNTRPQEVVQVCLCSNW